MQTAEKTIDGQNPRPVRLEFVIAKVDDVRVASMATARLPRHQTKSTSLPLGVAQYPREPFTPW